MKEDIAIIGMAGRFPDAGNIEELFDNLKVAKNSISDLSKKRIRETTLDETQKFKKGGYLEDIDKFDYKFFDISYAEAIYMSPMQRGSLETAYKTIENAGYNPADFNGSDVSVFICGPWYPGYVRHADEPNTMLDTGNSPEFLGAKVSRELNLLGNCVLVNAACSASIAALQMAVNELILGDCELAMVLGGNLDLFPMAGFESETVSKTGASTAFSDNIDGMVYGETFAGLLLKPLKKAIKDKDQIHAVITGLANNNNGNRSSSILATDSKQQCEVYLKAWDKAGINPEQLGFIEAHGSATQLGDCLEIEGLNEAFQQFTSKKNLVPVSSVKSNIGHTLAAAGLAGIVKTVLSLKNKVLFPNVNKGRLNSNIDFSKSSVYVNRELKEWNTENGETRMAGVSSFGRGGTNSHVVLREYIAPEEEITEGGKESYLFTFSSKTQAGLKRNITNILNKLPQYEDKHLKDISYTLIKGRQHLQYRLAVVCEDLYSLREKLEEALLDEVLGAHTVNDHYFVFSDQKITKETFEYFQLRYEDFRDASDEFKHADHSDDSIRSFVFQYAFYKLLLACGIRSKNLIGKGAGVIVRSFITGDLTQDEALDKITKYEEDASATSTDKIRGFLNSAGTSALSMTEMGLKGVVSGVVESINKENIQTYYLEDFKVGSRDPFLAFLAKIYTTRMNFNFEKTSKVFQGKRTELPSYDFEKTRCWIREEPKQTIVNTESEVANQKNLKEEGSEVENIIADAIARVLELSEISLTDDFFELGGDSLKATKLINEIKKVASVKLDFEDIFDFPTISRLAEYVETQITEELIVSNVYREVLKYEDEIKNEDDFFSLGGHSILATQVINRLKARYKIDLNFDELFFNATVGSLAVLIRDKINTENTGLKERKITVAEQREFYPVSHAQRRIIYSQQMFKSGTSYNATDIFEIKGEIKVADFEKAFNSLIERHEILRTSFHFVDGAPVQKVSESAKLKIHFKDLKQECQEAKTQDVVVKRHKDEFVDSFDLTKPPLFRVALFAIDHNKWVMVFDMDHSITDNTSHGILTREFLALLKGEKLKPLEVHYKDFTVWQHEFFRSEDFLKQEKYWLNQFKEKVVPIELPTDYPRSSETGHAGAEYSFSLDKKLTEDISALAKEKEVTVYILMLAVFKLLLFRLTRQNDICVGIPYAIRNNSELENMVGILLNTLVLRSFPQKNRSFSDYLSEIKDISLGAYTNSDYPFEMLLKETDYKRQEGRNPLFDVLFNSVTTSNQANSTVAENTSDNNELQFTQYNQEERMSTFDIYMMMQVVKSGIRFTVNYKTDLFVSSTIKYFMDEYQKLIKQIIENQNLELEEYSIFNKKKTKSNKIQVINNR